MTDAEQLALARRVDELEAECRALRARLDAAADSAAAGDDALGGSPEPPPQTAWTEPAGMTANPAIPEVTDTEASDAEPSSEQLRSLDRGSAQSDFPEALRMHGFDGSDDAGTVGLVAEVDAAGTGTSGAAQSGGTGSAASGDSSGGRNVRLRLTNPDGTWTPTSRWMIPVREDADGARTLRWCRLGAEVDFAAEFSGNDAPYLLKVRLTEKTESSANVECYFPDSGSGDYPPSAAAAAPHVLIGGSYNSAPGSGWQRLGSVSAGSGGRAYVVAVQSVDTSTGSSSLSTLDRTTVNVYFFATQAAFDSWVAALPTMLPWEIYSIVAYVKLDTLSVVQCGMGPHSVQPAVTDTEATGTFLSIDRPKAAASGQQQRPELAELQMHDFREPPSAGGFTVSIKGEWEAGVTVRKYVDLTPPETPAGATYLFPVRRVTRDKTELVWVTLSATGSFEIPRDPSQGSVGDQIYNDLMDLDTPGLYGYEVTAGNSAVLVSLDGNWWEIGGDETKCYGSAIGDSSQGKVIDLDGKAFFGGDWSVNSGSLSVGNNLQVDWNTNMDGTLTVSGHTNLGSVATGPLTVGGDFYVGSDKYAPQSVVIGGTTYTILVKQ